MKRYMVCAYVCIIISTVLFTQAVSAQTKTAIPSIPKIDISDVCADFSLNTVKGFTGTYTEPTHTAAQIRLVGQHLGEQIAEGKQFADDWLKNRYSVRRFNDADVFYVGLDAQVDTVKNLVRILAGYIEIAYNVSSSEADRIAREICVYNACYVNDTSYFAERFSTETLNSFSTSAIGLPSDYTQWAGNIKLIIPIAPITVKNHEQAPSVPKTAPITTPPSSSVETTKPAIPSTTLPNPAQTTEKPPLSIMMWLVIILIVVILIVVAVAAYTVYNKKQRDEHNIQ